MTIELQGWRPPQEFDEYRIVRAIGSGAMGQVYLGHDTLLDRPVAIKFISGVDPTPVIRERFFVEARAIARVQHSSVVSIYRVGEIAGHPYIVSEFIEGQSMDRLRTPIHWTRAADIGLALARGLAAAHLRGVLHRDVKPANAILMNGGGVKLVDFGLAKLVEPAHAGATWSDAPSEARTGTLAPEAGGDGAAPATMIWDERMGANWQEERGAKTFPDIASADGAGRTAIAVARPDPPPAVAPANLEGGGNAVLSESTDGLTRPGAVMGTPFYMAPEIWAGDPATRRSDIYAMGALLYELASGKPPHASTPGKALAYITLSKDARPLRQVSPDVDARFAAIVDRCLRRDPSERYPSADEVAGALEELTIPSTPGAVIVPEGNPYRGLYAFEAEHRGLFFGRAAEVRAVLERLRHESFILVAGDSGLGKSSLCRAGVLPLVLEGALKERGRWTVASMVPGKDPVSMLSDALSPHLGVDADTLAKRVTEERSLGSELREIHRDGAGLLIFIDQLEELATLSDPRAAAIFGETIARLAATSPGVRVLATVRSDFLTRIASVSGIGDEVMRALYLLRPLSSRGIREAIVGPAHAKGVKFESEALIDRLAETGERAEGGLPLLQFALAELWEARNREHRMITVGALEAIGGVEGALAAHGDHVLQSMLPAQRAIARKILTRLVTAEGTRARFTEGELTSGDASFRATLDMLVRARLLIAREAGDSTAYEVAHEALIRGWTTLRSWLEVNADQRRVEERIERGAAEWERLRHPEVLWGERQLADLALIHRDDLGPRETAFIEASELAVRRRRWRRRVATAGLISAILASSLGVWGAAQIVTRRKVDGLLADAAAKLAVAKVRSTELEELRTRTFARFDARDQEGGDALWSETRSRTAALEDEYKEASRVLETAIGVDPSRADVRALLAQALFERALLAERAHHPEEVREHLARLELYDAQREWIDRWNARGRVRVESKPPGAQVSLRRYRQGARERWSFEEGTRDLGRAPLEEIALERGSYLLAFTAPGRKEVLAPFVLKRGETLHVSVDIPLEGSIPEGFVYVPAGRFLFGTATTDDVTGVFYHATPLREVQVGSYIIAQHETTYGEWLAYLRSLPRATRRERMGQVAPLLKELSGGPMELTLQIADRTYTAREGDRITYARHRNPAHDWLRLPVSNVSFKDVSGYLEWLQASGKVSGARLCTDYEWERAARGADDRLYPHGDVVEAEDANFDLAYGAAEGAIGPDEVGAHPASRSPFGVDDMIGNVWELASSSLGKEPLAGRGGSFWSSLGEASIPYRGPMLASYRDVAVGFRVCSEAPASDSVPK